MKLWRDDSDTSFGIPFVSSELQLYSQVSNYQKLRTTGGEVLSWSFYYRGTATNDGTNASMTLTFGTISALSPSSYELMRMPTKFGPFFSNTSAWAFYNGTYTVPAGQRYTVVSFNGIASSNSAEFGPRMHEIAFVQATPPVRACPDRVVSSAPVTVVPVLDNDYGTSLTITSASSTNGSVSVDPGGALVYTSPPECGDNVISYSIADSQGLTSSSTVTVTVPCGPLPPAPSPPPLLSAPPLPPSPPPATQSFVTLSSACTASSSCSQAIQAALSSCAAKCTIRLGPGTFHLQDTIIVSGMSNVALVGAGSDSTVLVIDSQFTYVYVRSSANVTLADMTMEAERPFFTVGTYVGVEWRGSQWFSIFSYNPTLFPVNTTKYPWLIEVNKIIDYDITNGWFNADSNSFPGTYGFPDSGIPGYPGIVFNESASTFSARHIYSGSSVPIKTFVFFHGGNAHAVSADFVDGFTVHNVVLHSSSFMGFTAGACRDLTVDGFFIRPKPGYNVSVNFDGMHIDSPAGNVVIKNSEVRGSGDDGVNILTAWAPLDGAQNTECGVVPGTYSNGQRLGFAPGDVAVIYDGKTYNILGHFDVVSWDGITVSFSEPPPDFDQGLIANAKAYAQSVLIANTTFSRLRARGALIKQSNVTIVNTTFEYTSMFCALFEAAAGGTFVEGALFSNLVVKNSSFVGCNVGGYDYPDVQVDFATLSGGQYGRTPPVLSNVSFLSNTFVQLDAYNSHPNVAAFAVDGFSFVDNTVTVGTSLIDRAQAFFGNTDSTYVKDVICYSCSNVTVAGNVNTKGQFTSYP